MVDTSELQKRAEELRKSKQKEDDVYIGRVRVSKGIASSNRKRGGEVYVARSSSQAREQGPDSKQIQQQINVQKETARQQAEARERQRIINALRRVESGQSRSFSFQSTDGRVTASGPQQARDIRQKVEGRDRVRFGKVQLIEQGVVPLTERPQQKKPSGTRGFLLGAVQGAGGSQPVGVSQLAFGEPGKQFVGFGTAPIIPGINIGTARVTASRVQEKLRSDKKISKGVSGVITGGPKQTSFPSQVIAELTPTTPGEIAIAGGVTAISVTGGSAVRIGVSSGIATLESKRVFNPNLTKAERTASGVVGGLALAGGIAESVPYIRGLEYQTAGRLRGKFREIKVQQEGFKAIETPKDSFSRIGIIPEKSPLKLGKTSEVMLPRFSALKRGGFGVKQSEKIIYTGTNQYLATSQRNFFVEGKEVPLTQPLYLTPQDPILEIPVARKSRLALLEPFKGQKASDVQIGFGVPTKSQIGVTQANVKFSELGKGTELEVLKYGKITDVQRVGVTSIKGQGVQLYTFSLKESPGSVKTSQIITPSQSVTRISGEGVTSTTLASTKTSPIFIYPKTAQAVRTQTTETSRVISPSISPSVSVRTTPTSRPSPILSPGISPIVSPTITPPVTPRITPKTSPPITPKIYPLVRPPITPLEVITRRRDISRVPPKSGSGRFGVSVRRYGKFRPIASGVSLRQAINIGRINVGRTLGATFRLEGGPARGVRTPKGFKQKPGLIFIEEPKLRLSTLGETRAIRRARNR